MQNAYKNSGGDLVETVTALLTSDSFLFRKADLAGGAP
jgi:hypothetical protein